MGCFHRSWSVLSCFFVWSVAILRTTDGGNIIWYEPPPFETITDVAITSSTNKNLTKGFINEEISCNFSLTADLSVLSVAMSFEGDTVATYVRSPPELSVDVRFASRFNATWIPTKMTLIVFNVTTADEGEYRCSVLTSGGGIKTWVRIIEVAVLVPPSVIVSENQTVTEGDDVSLTCDAGPDGKPEPRTTLIFLSNKRVVSGNFTNISRQDAGGYRCTAENGVGSPVSKDVFIDVQYKPDSVSLDTSIHKICAGKMVMLTCSAGDSNPAVEILSLYKNGISLANVTRAKVGVFNQTLHTQGLHSYSCVASNAIGNASSSNTVVEVEVPASVIVMNRTMVVKEGDNVTLHCFPSFSSQQINVSWVNITNSIIEIGNFLHLTNISRPNQEYNCSASNACGNESRKVAIDVQYKPATVRLLANTTENKNCADFLLVNFTCGASEANPLVENYQLLKNQEILATSSKWTWVKNISEKGDHMYSCRAFHPLGNVTSANVTVTFNVPVQISVHVNSGTETLIEGGNLALSCNASGYPEPTVTWSKLNADELIHVTSNQSLSFTNINKEATGEYVCDSNNTCGKKRSSVRTINVQYKPENVSLDTSSHKICLLGKMVMLTCSAGDSNPAAENFTLYKNGVSLANVTRAKVGVFNQTLYTQGQHSYSCVASNAIGNASSSNTILEGEVPASVTVKNHMIVAREGDNVALHCLSSGSPQPNISWINISNYIIETGNFLNLTNISRPKQEYNCSASNTCGNDSRKVSIDVQYNPDSVSLVANTTENKNCADFLLVNFTCGASEANPLVENYQLLKNQEILATSSKWTWVKNISEKGDHMYSCRAFHPLGNVTSANVTVTFNVPVQISVHVNSGTETLLEGGNVSLRCNESGYPVPTVAWLKLNADEFIHAISNQSLSFTNIRREASGKYICNANNTCGEKWSSVRTIDVQYAAEDTGKGSDDSVFEGNTKLFSCPVVGNPKPNITWYNGSDVNGPKISNEEHFEAKQTGCYTCSARNLLGTPVTITQCLTVVPEPTSPTPTSKEQPMAEKPTSAMPTSTGQPIKEGPPWTIIGAVAGSVVSVAFVVALVTCWVHKRRKCIKDTKIHNSECEESLHGDSPNAKVNRAYAESGPPSASGTQQSQDLGAIPTYAVVDKSKKKKKKEEKPPIYASVDKSKKRKKKTDDKNLYDNVEEPKKERKPGEVLYAELGDFQNPAMPEVSTSPATLPPLRRPPSYEQTQYADITAFLKGDATLPQKEGNEGSEMQEQGANQSQHDVDNKETPIQEDSPCSRVNGAYAKSGPPSANSTDVSSAAQKQPAQEAGAIPTYAVVEKSKKKKKEPEEMPLVNTDKGKSKKKKKKTDDKNLYDSVEEPKKEKKPGEIFYADLGEFQKQEMPKVATSPPTLPPLKRAPSYEKTGYAEITQFLRKEATLPKVATSPPTLPPIKRSPSYEKTGYAEKEATLPPEKTPNSEMKPQAANQTHDEVENKETAL
ncbi:hemicentin-1-like [Montipora capricornis]|uniref:hemicentin-1-like n=1 Tax=Montipora capricornis TaxID=246305 RepID=UPI0035F131A6